MASKNVVGPLILQASSRGYAQAAPRAVKTAKVSSTVLPNKTLVAALDNGSPVTRVTIAFKAGSRYEPSSELGISHVLRSAAGLTTSKAASFITARKLAQIGASFTASGDREFVYYTLETTQDNLNPAIEIMKNAISYQEFRQWELDDNNPRLKFDIAALTPQARAVDLLHKAAFRRTLGNSLYISPKRIGKISSESLQHYACQTVSVNRCAVVIVGETQDKAAYIAQTLSLAGAGAETNEAAVYYGGDIRKEIGGDLAHIAIALPGARAGSKESLALACVAKALGSGPVTKWGSDNSPLARAIGNIGPFAIAGFNVSYSDTGLFGAVLSVPKDEAQCALKAVASCLKNPSLSSTDIQAGKNQLRVQLLNEADEGTSSAEALAAQGLYTGSVKTAEEISSEIDALSNNEIVQAFSNAAKNRLSVGAVGNLAFVPYSDEL